MFHEKERTPPNTGQYKKQTPVFPPILIHPAKVIYFLLKLLQFELVCIHFSEQITTFLICFSYFCLKHIDMNWKILGFSALLFGTITACEQSESVAENTSKEVTSDEVFAVEPNSVALVEVQGMSCEMGCGSEIRKGLKSSGAVASTKFVDFDADNETNIARIEFDDADLTDADIKKIIEGLNDGQFTVGAIEINQLEKTSETKTSEVNTEEVKKSEKATATMSETSWEFPNLFDLFSTLVM